MFAVGGRDPDGVVPVVACRDVVSLSEPRLWPVKSTCFNVMFVYVCNVCVCM